MKAAALIHAVRVAVTGKAVSPGLFEVLALLGRDAVHASSRRRASSLLSPRVPERSGIFPSAKSLSSAAVAGRCGDSFPSRELSLHASIVENAFLSAFIAESYGRIRGISVAARVFASTWSAEEGNVAKEDRGFASMDRGKQREIASKGGKAAHQKGTAHEWTSEEAREAGRKGGMASHRRKQEQTAGGQEPTSQSQRRTDRRELQSRADDGDSTVCRRLLSMRSDLEWPAQLLAADAIIGSSCLIAARTTGTGRSSNGRTRGSGPGYRGSNPCLPANFLASSSLVGCSARLSGFDAARFARRSRHESLPPSQLCCEF